MKCDCRIKALLFLICFLIFSENALQAYTRRNLLINKITEQQLEACLLMNKEWVNFPAYADRVGWNAFLGDNKAECIRRGEKRLNYKWEVVPASAYLEFEKSGNRKIMEDPYNNNVLAISDLLLAELAEGKGRFTSQLINGVFMSCEMTSWALSAHLVVQPSRRSLPDSRRQIIDLVSGDMGNLLSWTYYFMHDTFDKVNPEISRRLKDELQKRIMDPYMQNTYWWMAFNKEGQMVNNWNPWCNSNVLLTFMLMEDNRERMAKAVYRTMLSVDRFLNYVHADGACEEGPSYWGHASGKLLDYLQMLSMLTDGRVSIFHQPMIRNMGEYISRSYVGDGWVVNFADASAKGDFDPFLVYRYGQAVTSEELKSFAALINEKKPLPFSGRDFFRTLCALEIQKQIKDSTEKQQKPLFTWYPETEVCFMSDKKGLFFAAKGGYNDESHNHNDVGTFSLWIKNNPVLIDAGVGTYTRQTFSSERYSIWTMQSSYHNLPQINGVTQKHGRKYKSSQVKANAKKGMFSLDISKAYPEEAKVKSWYRNFKFFGDKLVITEKYELEQCLVPNVLHFMTWGKVDISKPGKIQIATSKVKAEMTYNESDFYISVDTIPQSDVRLSRVWGSAIYRLSLTAKKQFNKGTYSYTIKEL